jgi:hypothetical protein
MSSYKLAVAIKSPMKAGYKACEYLAKKCVWLAGRRFSGRSTGLSFRPALSPVTSSAGHRVPSLVGFKSKLKQIIRPYLSPRVKAVTLSIKSRFNGMRRYLRPLVRRSGVLFIGYAEGDLGLGHAFRGNLAGAAQVGLSFAVYPFRAGIETRLIEPFMLVPRHSDYDLLNPNITTTLAGVSGRR